MLRYSVLILFGVEQQRRIEAASIFGGLELVTCCGRGLSRSERKDVRT